MVRPYIEIPTKHDNQIIRIFDSKHSNNLFQWHKDDEDRRVIVITESKGWKFQFDDEIPFDLKHSTQFFIPKGIWHRIIKGDDTITLSIEVKNEKTIYSTKEIR